MYFWQAIQCVKTRYRQLITVIFSYVIQDQWNVNLRVSNNAHNIDSVNGPKIFSIATRITCYVKNPYERFAV